MKSCNILYWHKFFWILIMIIFSLPIIAQTNFRLITLDEALSAAKVENKLVFIDFYTDWCGPCKMMSRDVFPLEIVGDYMNQKFVCIQLNAEKEGKELAKVYNVNAYPTFIALNSEGKVVMTKIGGGTADSFIADIEQQINPEKSPQRLKERYESGERSADLISAYAALKLSESHGEKGKQAEEAYIIVKDYFDGLDEKEKLISENLFIYTHYAKDITSEISQFMLKHRNEFSTEDKRKIGTVIEKLYKKQIYYYLSAMIPYDVAVYNKVKQEINELGLNSAHSYDAPFRLIESHAKGNLDAYLDQCEQEYDKLDKEQQDYLLSSMGQLVKTDDPVILKKASWFIRSRLPYMSLNQIGFIVYPLSILEKQSHEYNQ